MGMSYTPTIGLEIHAELKTNTKMFCSSRNDPDETKPNVNVCPICMAHPGTLPVINREAVHHVLRVGVAMNGNIADFTEFDRKNYFYPDIPKGYQISQYKYPLISGGNLTGVDVTRIHLEEDTAKSSHKGDSSLVDFNRAGVPLMELVTEPVIKSAEQAGKFAREFRMLLRYLGAGDANMEKGEMRVEANISVSKDDNFGTKVEVKNLNSFRSVEGAIKFEIDRQIKLLESGGKVIQETRGWDENKQSTFSQRLKESSEEYRYFPDPDLPKLKLSEIPEFEKDSLEKDIREVLPHRELPWEKRAKYAEYGIQEQDVESLLVNKLLRGLLDDVLDLVTGNDNLVKLSVNYISSDLVGMSPEVLNFSAGNFVELIKMIDGGDVSSRGAKNILKIMVEKGGSPSDIANEEGLLQQSDEGAIKEIAKKILNENPNVADEFKAGKENSLQYLIGQGMKETKGAANPQVLQKIFKKLLK